MPKNKFQEVIFTIIMATVMVYGMVVYNVALNMGEMTNQTFLIALHELPIKMLAKCQLKCLYNSNKN